MNFKKVAYFALGPFSTALVGFITLPILTWMYSQEVIAKYSLIQVFVSLTLLVFTLGLDQAFVREYHEYKTKNSLILSLGLPGFFFLLIVFSAIIVGIEDISVFGFEADSAMGYIFMAGILVCNYLIRFIQINFRMREEALLYSLTQVLPRFLFLTLLIGSFYLDITKEFDNLLLAFLISYIITVMFSVVQMRKAIGGLTTLALDLSIPKSVMNYALPLVLSGIAYWGLTSLDKLMLKNLSSLEELAIYSVAVNFSAVAIIFQQVFSTIWTPAVYKMNTEGFQISFLSDLINLVKHCIILIFSFSIFLKPLVVLVLPDPYKDVEYLILSCLMVPLLYTYSECTKIGIGITRKTHYTVLVSFISVALSVLLNWILIPYFGASGASVATLLSFYVFYILRTEFSKFVWKKVTPTSDYVVVLCLVITACLDSLLKSEVKGGVLLISIALMIGTITSIYNKKEKFKLLLLKK